ncbi:MAG: LPP20 family lipoprotein [Spirochaetales bacterium]|nr:LPP20 family lipoprotein [Spirochaetales bacterium]
MELISRKLMIFAVMAFCLTMFAGAASKNVADKPEWLIQLPESGDYIYAVGFAEGGKLESARESALQNARLELSKHVVGKIKELCDDYLYHAKKGSALGGYSNIMAAAVSQNVILGAELKDSYTEKNGKLECYYALLGVRTKSVELAIEDYQRSMRKSQDYASAESDLEDMVSSIKKRYNREVMEKREEVKAKQKAAEPELRVQEGGKEPAWVKRLPNDRAYYIGIGNASTLEGAKANAVNTVVSQIQVKLQSMIKDYTQEVNGESYENSSVLIKMSVKADIEDVEYFDAWQSPNGTYWVYARLNIATYQRKQAEKMENARITAMDYLKKCDEESNPVLKFKNAFLGYYYISPYITKALKADYNGKSVIIINELMSRMNKVMSETSISAYQTPDELKMSKVDTKPLQVDWTFRNGGTYMEGLPVHFSVSDNAGTVTPDGVTDYRGGVSCVITKLNTAAPTFSLYAEPYFVGLIGGFIDDPEEQAYFERKVAQFQMPKKQLIVEVEKPKMGFAVYVADEFQKPKFNSKAVNFGNTFKQKFAEKMKTDFVDSGARYNLSMTVSGSVQPSDSGSGFIFARMTVSFKVIDNKNKKEIYNLVCNEIKQGANTDLKAVQQAMNKFDMDSAVDEILANGIN